MLSDTSSLCQILLSLVLLLNYSQSLIGMFSVLSFSIDSIVCCFLIYGSYIMRISLLDRQSSYSCSTNKTPKSHLNWEPH